MSRPIVHVKVGVNVGVSLAVCDSVGLNDDVASYVSVAGKTVAVGVGDTVGVAVIVM